MPTQNIYDLLDVWNNSGTTFTGIKLSVTDTASASGSLLMDLQVGSNSGFQVAKNGLTRIWQVGTSSLPFMEIGGNNQVRLRDAGVLAWTNGGAGATSDVFLARRAAANLRLGAADAAAPVAQTLSVQSGIAGASALSCSISGTTLTVGGAVTGTIAIGYAVTGTGVSAGTVITAGSGTTWTVNNSQTVSSTTMYFNSVGQNLTITGSQGSGPSAGGSIVFQVAPAGSAGTTAQNALVTFLEATSARAFNLYNTTDVTTNYERGFMRWSADTFVIGTDKAGTGQTRNISILPFANLRLGSNGSDRLSLGTNNFIPLTNGGVSLGLTANRFSDLFLTGSLNTGAPAGGTAAAWKLGTVASVSPTSPNRTIEVEIGGTTYYIAAKTTND